MAGLSALLRSRTIAMVMGALLLAGCSSGGGSTAAPGDVSIWVAWGGAELKAFRDVLKPFETANPDIKIHITTNRDSTNQIANGIAAGTDLPDSPPDRPTRRRSRAGSRRARSSRWRPRRRPVPVVPRQHLPGADHRARRRQG